MQAIANPGGVMRRFADDQLVTLAKLVVETAFQPIVEVGSGFVFGYESLMRGHQKLGFSTPTELLDHAHAVNQLIPLEQLLLNRAIVKFASLPETHNRLLFVNFDARLLGNYETVVERLLQLLQRSKISPVNVCIELSERFDNARQPDFKLFTERLSQHGFKLAIDDFGLGHGEMMLLSDYAIDYLKIDRYFIDGIDTTVRKRHLVRNFVKMAHVLGVRVIAEGVETEAQLAVCRDLGCDLVQGWIIAHPTVHCDQLLPSYPHTQAVGSEKRQSHAGDELLIRREIEQLPVVRETDSTDVVFALFREFPLQNFFPVIDAQGMPLGIIHEQQLKFYIYQPYGRDLLRNKAYKLRVCDFLKRAPFASLSSDAELLLDVFANASGSDCLILTENMRYAGVLSAASLLRIINAKQLKSAQDQNPLTALPGNRSISEFVQEAMHDGDQDRFLCYCDFDFFKPFNDRYGFQQGDHAITLFATLMRRYFVGEDVFLGHVGGDDFFVGIQGRDRDAVQAAVIDMLEEFRHQVSFLYSPEDRAAGLIPGSDRSGSARTYPLMRCSVAILELAAGVVISDGKAVGQKIACLKSQAKDHDTGLVLMAF